MSLVRITLLAAALAACPLPVPCLLAQERGTRFAPGVVSTGDVFATTFEPDGRTVYFNRSRRQRDTLHIHRAVRTADGWADAGIAPFSGRWRDIDPFVTPDGRRLLFNSNRPLAGGDSAEKFMHTWVMEREGDGWGEPRPVRELVKPGRNEYFTTAARNGTLYYTVQAEGTRNSSIARAPLVDGRYGPEEIVAAFESDSGDTNPLVAPDESFVIFVSSRPGGVGGADLYISFRDGSRWTPPALLGAMNTPDSEFAPGFSRDGRTLYFTRMRVADGRIAEEDVFEVPFDAAAVRRRVLGRR